MVQATRLLLLFLLGASLSAQLPIPRIVAIGDSITEGNVPFPSYRRELWQQLRSMNYCFDFVGTKRGVFGGVLTTPPAPPAPPVPAPYVFDQDHYGTWGITAEALYANLGSAPGQFDATIALIQLGSNTVIEQMMFHNATPDKAARQVVEALVNIVSELRSNRYNPNMKILVAQLTPLPIVQGVRLDNGIIATNAEIAAKFAGTSVRVVNQWNNFDLLTDTWDNPPVHPNASGNLKIATNWRIALTTAMGSLPPVLPPPSPGSGCVQDYGFGALFDGLSSSSARMVCTNTALPVCGSTINLSISGLLPASVAVGMLSSGPAVLPVPPFSPLNWESIWVDPTGSGATAAVFGGTDLAGNTSWPLPVPQGTACLLGVDFYIQAGTLNSSGIRGTTNGAIIRIG